jgi:hypothetical protein
MDYSPVQVDMVPGELAELTWAQAQGDRDDEQGRQPLLLVASGIEA